MKQLTGQACSILLATALALSGCAGNASTAQSEGGGESASSQAQQSAVTSYEGFFDDDVIDIRVTIDDADWQDILSNPTAEEYHTAAVTADGVTVENVGFRTKGNLTLNTTAQSDSDRYSFRIKFDKYVDGQTLNGLNELVVNNCLFDPSYLREYLSYEAMREIGLDSPMTVFANVYINDELFGFYLAVEAVDDSMLERLYGSGDQNLYKADMGSTLLADSIEKLEQKKGDDESKDDLKNLIDTLAAMPEGEKGDIENVLDVDSALKYIAANAVLGNEDSYLGRNAQNYYLRSSDGVFTVIPWDYNMSFGSSMGAGGDIGGNMGQGGFGGRMPGAGQRPDGLQNTDRSMPEGMVPPDGASMTPPDGGQQMTPPDDTQNGERPEGRQRGSAVGQGGAGGAMGERGTRTSPTEASITEPVFQVDAESRPLVQKLLAAPEYYETYLGYVKELTAYLQLLDGRVADLSETIRPYVQADPTAFYTVDQFDEEVSGEGDTSTLMGFVSARVENLLSQLNASSSAQSAS